ncbi:MAG: MBL fold metallo-hydrolase [Spirochaetales bacterium]
MEIKILGTGGFENEGLPFNAFLVDGHLLVENPPDILQSLRREKINIGDIDTIVITHFHGDHCFGLPFLLFNLYLERGARKGEPLRLFAPAGVREWMKEMLSLAISPEHPYVEWSLSALDIREIIEGETVKAGGQAWMKFSRSEHSPTTYSISFGEGSALEPMFIATSDTRWSPRLEKLFSMGSRLVLCDSGGSGFGGVHLSPQEIESLVLPLLDSGTKLVATHFRTNPPAGGRLDFARSGDVYKI